MVFRARVGNDYLYRAPDGREAWVIFNREKRLAYIVTDIHGNGQPDNAIAFPPDALRAIADELERIP